MTVTAARATGPNDRAAAGGPARAAAVTSGRGRPVFPTAVAAPGAESCRPARTALARRRPAKTRRPDSRKGPTGAPAHRPAAVPRRARGPHTVTADRIGGAVARPPRRTTHFPPPRPRWR